MYTSFSSGLHFEKNWLRKLRTIALPVYFMVSNFYYGIQLSIIHVSKCCLMLVTFYPSVVILRVGGYMGIEIEYPFGYASSGDSLFRDRLRIIPNSDPFPSTILKYLFISYEFRPADSHHPPP